jgi:hypothetical protein
MRLFTVNKFLFCFSLQQGVKVMGWLWAILSGILTFALLLGNVSQWVSFIYPTTEDPNRDKVKEASK